jgi:NADPH:quinone reductase-like Zn-dependent oxidoreductase
MGHEAAGIVDELGDGVADAAVGDRVFGLSAEGAAHEYLCSLGAETVAYGEGLAGRVRALAPGGVDLALDVAGNGVLPELVDLASGSGHVITIADFAGAREHGVRFSSGDVGRAVHALAGIGDLIESGRFSLPVARAFPLAEVAQAHRVGQEGHVRGKLVLLVG